MTEEQFLEQIKNTYVTIYLSNGVGLQGVIKSFDEKTILLNNNLIYKTAIASIQMKEAK